MARATSVSAPETVPLFTFVADDRTMTLAEPLLLRVAIEDDTWFVENDALHLFGKGASLAEAVGAFSRDLAYYWRYYNALRDEDVAGAGVERMRAQLRLETNADFARFVECPLTHEEYLVTLRRLGILGDD
jgi:hypothetical protein